MRKTLQLAEYTLVWLDSQDNDRAHFASTVVLRLLVAAIKVENKRGIDNGR